MPGFVATKGAIASTIGRLRGTYRGVEAFRRSAHRRGDHAADTHKRVKRREMRGYFGQWPRIKFGMMPAEGGLIDGKSIAVEPALLTTI
ncbi:hypothetical protein P3T40_006941 [Paraburkholderia sp. EB58]|jgi:hypothetical protein|uniref:hypothetical protein n=1 Tax=Paraburkholderia sp. EB58 TaxID=3035125 RepID=UPI003D2475FB